jgi:Zn-dependent metalloprotease
MRMLVALFGFVLCLGLAAGGMAQPFAAPEDIANVLRTLQAPASAESPVLYQSDEGFLRFLGAPPGGRFVSRPPAGKTADPGGFARNYIEDHRGAFGVNNPKVSFATRNARTQTDQTYVRLKQHYQGLGIFAADIVVQVDAEGGIRNVVSEVMRNTEELDAGQVALVPGISAATAISRAKTDLAGELDGVNPDDLAVNDGPELMLFSPALLELQGGTRLTWRMVLANSTGEPIKEQVFVDAQTGEICFHYSMIVEGKSRLIYDANNTWTMPSTPVRDEGAPATGIQDVDDAYDYLGDTYDFYFREHGRDGIDDEGSDLIALVRLPWENASWNGVQMNFGTGFAIDDVTAHELTHGVSEDIWNFIYFGESGALSETFSDSWGEFVDLTNGRGNDSPEVRWSMGEDLPKSFLDRYYPNMAVPGIRNMKDPTIFGDPDRYYSPFFRGTTSSFDNGGVHFNCGVGNKLTYLLTDGDTFNGQTVRGMGISRTADLMYAAQFLLPSFATYNMYYLAIGAASSTLGYSMEDRLNLAKAGRAVEIEPPGLNIGGLRGFRATPAFTLDGDPVIALNWTPPPAEEYSRVVLVRSLGGYVEDPGAGEVLFDDKGDRYLDEDVQSGVEYFYTLFADLTNGLPQVAYARATAGATAAEVLSEAFSSGVLDQRIDLAFTQLMFTPVGPPVGPVGGSGGATGYDGYEATLVPDVYNLPVPRSDTQGNAFNLTLTDDGYVTFRSDRAGFPFFGQKYSVLYIASNGYIAFQALGSADDLNFPSLASHFAVPRISYLFSDLAPNIGGEVWARDLPDRMVLTFEHVPQYIYTSTSGLGIGNPIGSSVQVELFYSGHIRITYQQLQNADAVVGLSDGNGVPIDPADLFDNLRSVNLLSDLSELPEESAQLSLDPVAPQIVEAGELVAFTVQAHLPAGVTQFPALSGEWDGSGPVPFANNGDGTGSFYWQTTTADRGTFTVRIRAILGEEVAYQDVRIQVGQTFLLPAAVNLRLSTGTPAEDPEASRVIPVGRPLFAEYQYTHPQLTEDPVQFAEGPSIIYWFRNHQVVPALTNSLEVPPPAVRANDVWYFRIIPVTVSLLSGEEAMSPVVTVAGQPELSQITPAKGLLTGGDAVRIRGSRLNGTLSVTFGGVPAAEVRVLNDSEIEVITPLHPLGRVDVVVTTVSGSSRLSNAFEFVEPAQEGEPEDKEGACLGCGAGGSAPVTGTGDLALVVLVGCALVLLSRRTRAGRAGD